MGFLLFTADLRSHPSEYHIVATWLQEKLKASVGNFFRLSDHLIFEDYDKLFEHLGIAKRKGKDKLVTVWKIKEPRIHLLQVGGEDFAVAIYRLDESKYGP